MTGGERGQVVRTCPLLHSFPKHAKALRSGAIQTLTQPKGFVLRVLLLRIVLSMRLKTMKPLVCGQA